MGETNQSEEKILMKSDRSSVASAIAMIMRNAAAKRRISIDLELCCSRCRRPSLAMAAPRRMEVRPRVEVTMLPSTVPHMARQAKNRTMAQIQMSP